MFTMKTDSATGIIDIAISGIWTLDRIAVFTDALRSAASQIALTGKRHAILCDFTGVSIQPQEVVTALQRLVRATRVPSRKCALYTCGVLARQQAKRIAAARDTIAVFNDRDSAVAWLRDDATLKRPADHYYGPLPPDAPSDSRTHYAITPGET